MYTRKMGQKRESGHRSNSSARGILAKIVDTSDREGRGDSGKNSRNFVYVLPPFSLSRWTKPASFVLGNGGAVDSLELRVPVINERGSDSVRYAGISFTRFSACVYSNLFKFEFMRARYLVRGTRMNAVDLNTASRRGKSGEFFRRYR